MSPMHRLRRRALVALAVVVALAVGAGAAYAGSTWTTVAHEPQLRPLHNAWNASLDATVYGQPLVIGGRVYAATENNSVYALDAHDGRVLWKRHLGPPMTNVAAQVRCGNVDPLGILSTPMIDTVHKTIYVVAT